MAGGTDGRRRASPGDSGVQRGVVFGVLTYAATPNLPAAVLAGLTAAGASFLGLRQVIGR
ncbi:hypothetical protein ACFTWD_01100 [Streptomyces sp. NPDC056943]|uniref:hypothetical protein n=1 Tax=Streptomyces sp. NPDC056943 TaxID=3345971 RepID=UPI00363E96FD